MNAHSFEYDLTNGESDIASQEDMEDAVSALYASLKSHLLPQQSKELASIPAQLSPDHIRLLVNAELDPLKIYIRIKLYLTHKTQKNDFSGFTIEEINQRTLQTSIGTTLEALASLTSQTRNLLIDRLFERLDFSLRDAADSEMAPITEMHIADAQHEYMALLEKAEKLQIDIFDMQG